MKKIFLAILTLLYLSSSVGITLHKHYCLGMPGEGRLNHKVYDKCSKDKVNEKSNDCCKNENRFFKNDNDQERPEPALQLAHVTVLALPSSYIGISLDKINPVMVVNPISHAPPINGNVSIYIRNCVFLI